VEHDRDVFWQNMHLPQSMDLQDGVLLCVDMVLQIDRPKANNKSALHFKKLSYIHFSTHIPIPIDIISNKTTF